MSHEETCKSRTFDFKIIISIFILSQRLTCKNNYNFCITHEKYYEQTVITNFKHQLLMQLFIHITTNLEKSIYTSTMHMRIIRLYAETFLINSTDSTTLQRISAGTNTAGHPNTSVRFNNQH